jgi:hypothetical protein
MKGVVVSGAKMQMFLWFIGWAIEFQCCFFCCFGCTLGLPAPASDLVLVSHSQLLALPLLHVCFLDCKSLTC